MQPWLYFFSPGSPNDVYLLNHYKYSPINVPDLETTSLSTPILYIMLLLN